MQKITDLFYFLYLNNAEARVWPSKHHSSNNNNTRQRQRGSHHHPQWQWYPPRQRSHVPLQLLLPPQAKHVVRHKRHFQNSPHQTHKKQFSVLRWEWETNELCMHACPPPITTIPPPFHHNSKIGKNRFPFLPPTSPSLHDCILACCNNKIDHNNHPNNTSSPQNPFCQPSTSFLPNPFSLAKQCNGSICFLRVRYCTYRHELSVSATQHTIKFHL